MKQKQTILKKISVNINEIEFKFLIKIKKKFQYLK